MHRPHIPPNKYFWCTCLFEAGLMPGPQCCWRIMSMKNCNDTTSNQPATFQLAAQCLHQLRYHVPAPSSHGLTHSCSVVLNCFIFLNTTLPTTAHKFITAREVKMNWHFKIVIFWDARPRKSRNFHIALNILIFWDATVCNRSYFWHFKEM